MIKKATVAALTAVMIFAPIVNVKASSSDVIDTKNRIHHDPQIRHDSSKTGRGKFR